MLKAEELVKCGKDCHLILDDDFGKTLANDRSLNHTNTPALIKEMVIARALSARDGQRVWHATFTNRAKWPAYDEWLSRECPSLVLDAD